MEQYLPQHRMRDIIADNELLLMALSRFNITLGFGDSTVADVCNAQGVDCNTFLAVANFISGKPHSSFQVSLSALTMYLKNAHTYFLKYVLPGIRRRLIEAISTGVSGDVSFLILKFFDEYTAEVHRHMEYENSTVFTYVDALLRGECPTDFNLETFEDAHEPVAEKLRELKEIFICHFHADGARVDQFNSVLFDIITTERDINMHCRVEDVLFVPAVRSLRVSMENRDAQDDMPGETKLDDNGDIELTARERDIVKAIARGLSNKEIADQLFISPHTVATHRRNICAKLNIHSASGMTLFAIIHGLISLEEANDLLPGL
ncbi:MAG: LuxR C-terminal-related transcriptional regulator [Muribaculaceae bacterium]|nr:LuxR C-terminal-related transcriptional regulator [Muribaculaceae bacterium]